MGCDKLLHGKHGILAAFWSTIYNYNENDFSKLIDFDTKLTIHKFNDDEEIINMARKVMTDEMAAHAYLSSSQLRLRLPTN